MTASMADRDRNTWTVAVAIVALLTCHAVDAAEPATTFTHRGEEDGLPSRTVWAIAQDQQGCMWFASSSGLARYDGIEMVVYRHDPQNSRSLVHDDISGLLVDRAGLPVCIGPVLVRAEHLHFVAFHQEYAAIAAAPAVAFDDARRAPSEM